MYVSHEAIVKALLLVLGLPALTSLVLCWAGAVIGDRHKPEGAGASRVAVFAAGFAASVAAFLILTFACNAYLFGAISSPLVGGLIAYVAARFQPDAIAVDERTEP